MTKPISIREGAITTDGCRGYYSRLPYEVLLELGEGTSYMISEEEGAKTPLGAAVPAVWAA
jgi:hypothetical protein